MGEIGRLTFIRLLVQETNEGESTDFAHINPKMTHHDAARDAASVHFCQSIMMADIFVRRRRLNRRIQKGNKFTHRGPSLLSMIALL